MMMQRLRRLWRIFGVLLLLSALPGDCLVGMLLLAGGGWQLFLWHVPLVLLWTAGVYLITWRDGQRLTLARIHLNIWGLSALLLGMGTFPGLGSCMYSVAFLFTRSRFAFPTTRDFVAQEHGPRALSVQGDEPSPHARAVQPLIDDLRAGDTEARRTVVAKLSRSAQPGTTRMLRRLLVDAQAEIRSDAATALARLDDEMARELDRSFTAWSADSADAGRAMTLVDHYYAYASSNVLDSKTQHFYLVLARDLLLQVLAREHVQDAQLWLKLARVRQRLGELAEALRDACHALHIQPDASEAVLLAMELAFRAHSWETLISLAGYVANARPCHRDQGAALESLQWWATLRPGLCGDARHA